jgi:hypothetical protein
MIREALLKAEALGTVAIAVDAARDSRNVLALNSVGPDARCTRLLEGLTYSLCAELGTGRFTIAEALRKLGYTGGAYTTQTWIGKEREMLAAELNWPNDMTLEDLRAEAKARAAFWARADGEAAE